MSKFQFEQGFRRFWFFQKILLSVQEKKFKTIHLNFFASKKDYVYYEKLQFCIPKEQGPLLERSATDIPRELKSRSLESPKIHCHAPEFREKKLTETYPVLIA